MVNGLDQPLKGTFIKEEVCIIILTIECLFFMIDFDFIPNIKKLHLYILRILVEL